MESAETSTSKIKLIIRALISLALLAWVYSAFDISELAETLLAVSWQTALLIPLGYAVGQVISALKWRVLFSEVGIARSVGRTIRAYFVGMFVNTFGLGTIGGDAVRSMAIEPAKGQRAASVASVVADRVHGLAVLASIGAVAILVVRPQVLGSAGVLGAGVIVALALLGWWLGPMLLRRIFPDDHALGQAARQIAEAFPHRPAPLISATVLSLAFHTLQILLFVAIVAELDLPISTGYLFATIPLVNIASSLPISVMGLGVRESLYIVLFSPLGVSPESAAAIGAIWIVSVTLVNAVGGALAASAMSSETIAGIWPRRYSPNRA